MSHFLGAEKCRRAIWCEIFMVWEGYIPYLKTWSHESSRSSVKQCWEEGKVHSDVQRLVPGGSSGKHSKSPKVTNSTVEDKPLKHDLASHQKKLTRKHDQVMMTGV